MQVVFTTYLVSAEKQSSPNFILPTATDMMYMSLHVAFYCLLLSVSRASEGVLPITRGGATAVSKYSEDNELKQQQKYTVPRGLMTSADEVVEDNNNDSYSSSSRSRPSTSRAALTSRILKKRSKKNTSQSSDSQLESHAITEHQRDDVELQLMQHSVVSDSLQEFVTEKVMEKFVEPMCRPDEGRFALFPIRNHRMWEMYKKHVASFWTVSDALLRINLIV